MDRVSVPHAPGVWLPLFQAMPPFILSPVLSLVREKVARLREALFSCRVHNLTGKIGFQETGHADFNSDFARDGARGDASKKDPHFGHFFSRVRVMIRVGSRVAKPGDHFVHSLLAMTQQPATGSEPPRPTEEAYRSVQSPVSAVRSPPEPRKPESRPASEAGKKAGPRPNRKGIFGVALGVLLALALTVGTLLYYQSFYVRTEDAQIANYVSPLAPLVGGKVIGVFVDVDQPVKGGQLLIRIDPRGYQTTLSSRLGDLASARARLDNARMTLDRMEKLFRGGASTQAALDDSRAAYRNLQGLVASLQAQMEQARLNLAYCDVHAPMDGHIAQRNVQPGMVVEPGQPILNFVEGVLPWVIANFKETELSRIRRGQRAEVSVDAIGKSFPARVDSFSPATGSEFAVIPPQNATGNFIKIVQRIPVKLVFDPQALRGYESRLVAGSSVEVKVYVR